MALSTMTLPAPAPGATLRGMPGAVIYIRVSTKEQTENLSLPTSCGPARSTAAAKGSRYSSGSRKRAKARRRHTAPNCNACSPSAGRTKAACTSWWCST